MYVIRYSACNGKGIVIHLWNGLGAVTCMAAIGQGSFFPGHSPTILKTPKEWVSLNEFQFAQILGVHDTERALLRIDDDDFVNGMFFEDL